MGQFKEREQTDSALYYYEPPQYYYEEGRSFKLRQTIGPFMVSFNFNLIQTILMIHVKEQECFNHRRSCIDEDLSAEVKWDIL